jgi:hypothetical protein
MLPGSKPPSAPSAVDSQQKEWFYSNLEFQFSIRDRLRIFLGHRSSLPELPVGFGLDVFHQWICPRCELPKRHGKEPFLEANRWDNTSSVSGHRTREPGGRGDSFHVDCAGRVA